MYRTRPPFVVCGMFGLFCLIAGCSGQGDGARKEEPAVGGPAKPADRQAAPAPSVAQGPPVVLVEIVEVNRDGFPYPLHEFHDEPDLVPFAVEGDRLLLFAEPPHEDDEDDLFGDATPSLVLGDPETPASDCRLFVVHYVIHAGVGRGMRQATYYAFPGPSSRIELPQSGQADEFVHDPATAEVPFDIAIYNVRLLPESAGAIEIHTGDGDQAEETLIVRLAGIDDSQRSLAPGESAELADESREIAVRESPCWGTIVEWDDVDLFADTPPPPDDDRQRILLDAGHDFGSIRFSTKLEVRHGGRYALTLVGPADDQARPEGLFLEGHLLWPNEDF